MRSSCVGYRANPWKKKWSEKETDEESLMERGASGSGSRDADSPQKEMSVDKY